MTNPWLIISALLLTYTPPTVPFSIPSRFVDRMTKTLHRARYNDISNDDERLPATHIGKGTKIQADTFKCTNPLVIEGELDIKKLECREEIYISGKVRGNIKGGVLVTVDGELEGSVECSELVVGPAGMVTGDVDCRDLIIRPGGKIGGQLSCENMKSERDVFHNTKSPLPQVVYDRNPSSRATTPRDSVVAALRAMSDRQTTYEVPLDNVRTDDYGNPLIGAASEEQVKSLRKNREEIFATRSFLDRAVTRKVELPDWAQAVKSTAKQPPVTKHEARDALKEKQVAKASLHKTPAAPSPATETERFTSDANMELPGFLESPYGKNGNEEQRMVDKLLKQKTGEFDNDYQYTDHDALPDDGYTFDDEFLDDGYIEDDEFPDGGYTDDDRLPDFLR